MKDQRELWNEAHQKRSLHEYSSIQTTFAEEVNALIPAHSSVLELGCGEGNDSIYFARQGHTIVATDFSDVVIGQNRERWSDPGLKFVQQDIEKPLAFVEASFDEEYVREILADQFENLVVETGAEKLYERNSSFIKVSAVKA